MLSESQTADTIAKWLKSWVAFVTPPNEAVTDDQAALQSALVTAFTKFNCTKDYIEHCFKVLEKKSTEVPSCFVRLDTSHFCKTLSRLPCLKDLNPFAKMFYLKCLKCIKICENYETIKQLVWDLIVVSTHKCTGKNKKDYTTCSVSTRRLKDLIYNTNSVNELEDTQEVVENDSDVREKTEKHQKDGEFVYGFKSIFIKTNLF